MYIIAGLGNPGKQYEHTRHNVGFDTLDKLAEKYHIPIDTQKHKAVCGSGSLSGNYGKVLKNMKFSKETRQINNFIVPCAVLLEDVSIAGC